MFDRQMACLEHNKNKKISEIQIEYFLEWEVEIMTEEERRRLKAIALSYERGEEAPKVVASGKGYIAEKILDQATDANVPVHKDEKVANALSDVEIGAFIPQELYEVVAEILVFVGDMDTIRGKIKK